LEDKYTKDTILRLKKVRLQVKNEDKKKVTLELTDKNLHEKRVKEILGL